MEHERDKDSSCYWRALYRHQTIAKATVRLRNKRTSVDYSDRLEY